jgi:hypothetical protein
LITKLILIPLLADNNDLDVACTILKGTISSSNADAGSGSIRIDSLNKGN